MAPSFPVGASQVTLALTCCWECLMQNQRNVHWKYKPLPDDRCLGHLGQMGLKK